MAGPGDGICPEIQGFDALRQRIRRLSDQSTISEALRRRLVRAWEGGADAFIRAAIRRVLVDTGMSAATFLPLSRSINRVQSTAIIEAHIAREGGGRGVNRRGIPTFPHGGRRAGFQGVDAGEALGERAFIFQVPAPNARFFVFRFSFQTVAFQHAIHEDMQQSLEAGIDAFQARIRATFIEQAELVIRPYLRGRNVPIQGIIQ